MKIIFCLLVIAVCSPEARACDNLRIQHLNNIDFENDPSPAEHFEVRRSGDDPCSFFLTVDNGGASSYTGRRLLKTYGQGAFPVQVCRDASCSSILKHIPEATSGSDVLVGSFPRGGSDEIDFVIYPRLGVADYPPFGRYEDIFTVRLYEGSITGSRSLEDSDNFRLRQEVSKRIDLSVVNSGQPFDPNATNKSIDFGTLTTGKQFGFDLVLKYNAGYRVRVSSQNNGKLKHNSLASTIDYTMSVGGSPVSLGSSSSSPVQVSQGSGASPTGGMRLQGNFTIGSVASNAQSGSYRDSITITVATTE